MAKVTQTFLSITFADDSVGVMGFVLHEYQPDGVTVRWSKEPTTENIEAEINRGSYDPGKLPFKSWRFIDPKELPADREFRDAWKDDGQSISHDMVKARELCMKRLRLARADRLAALDRDWMRAMGQKGDAESIEAKRQALRDFPQEISAALEAATDIEALKAIQLPE